RQQVAGQRGAPETHVNAADALVAVEAEIVEGEAQLAAVTLSGAPCNQVGQHRSDAEISRRILRATGRDEEVECGRTHVLHPLGQERQSVGKSVLIDRHHDPLVWGSLSWQTLGLLDCSGWDGGADT